MEADSDCVKRNEWQNCSKRKGKQKIMRRQLDVVATLRGLKYPKAAAFSRDDVLWRLVPCLLSVGVGGGRWCCGCSARTQQKKPTAQHGERGMRSASVPLSVSGPMTPLGSLPCLCLACPTALERGNPIIEKKKPPLPELFARLESNTLSLRCCEMRGCKRVWFKSIKQELNQLGSKRSVGMSFSETWKVSCI